MPKFDVQIARSVREYANVQVTARSAAAAERKVERILASDDDEYTDLVNNASWDPGGDTFDEAVIGVEQVANVEPRIPGFSK